MEFLLAVQAAAAAAFFCCLTPHFLGLQKGAIIMCVLVGKKGMQLVKGLSRGSSLMSNDPVCAGNKEDMQSTGSFPREFQLKLFWACDLV
jgi:hypothetical protein